MAIEAAKKALEMSGTNSEEIDVLIVGTVTPDYKLPSTACIMQEKMNFSNAAAFDIVAACTGFISGMSIGSSYIESGLYKKALVIGVEKLSSFTNYEDRNTCVLFGDAAGAAVLEQSNDESGVLASFLRSDGRYRPLLWSEVGGAANPYTSEYAYNGTDKIMMNGTDLFKVAVREMANAAKKVIEKAGVAADDISLVVPHQANIRIIEGVVKRLGVGMDRVFLNIHKYGNTSSASVPLALDEANREGRIKEGDLVLMVAFGGGLIWGANLVRW